jgi:hypothetical protein
LIEENKAGIISPAMAAGIFVAGKPSNLSILPT